MNLRITSIDDATAEIVFIPLEKLVAWQDNPRKTGRDRGIDELAASIAAHGLLQSLVVTPPDQDGNALVIAGERRLKALNILREQGKISARAGIACRVAEEGQDLAELALAENAVREAMHPADQFEAFMRLKKEGMDMAEIAARFGLSENTVIQRLKLASLSPVVLAAYREGKINLSQAQAFAITKDHDRQEEILQHALEEQDRYDEPMSVADIREGLLDKELTARDLRVKYVTLESYEEAGGTVSRDLFDDDDRYITLDNPKLLQDLFEQKISARVSELKAHGFSWAEYREELDYSARQSLIELHDHDELCGTQAQADKMAELDALYNDLEERIGDMTADDDIDAEHPELKKLVARQTAVDEERDALSADIELTWPDEIKAIAGVIIKIRHDGTEYYHIVVHKENKGLLDKIRAGESVDIEQGVVSRAEDDPDSRADNDDNDQPSPSEVEISPLPHTLVETLTAYKSAAIATELAKRPQLALVCVVHALLDDLLCVHNDNCVQIEIRETSYGKLDTLVESIYQELDERTPADKHSDDTALWYWLLGKDRDELIELLAKVTALGVHTIIHKHSDFNESRTRHGNAVAQSLGLDMGAHFTPTAENYFNHVGRGRIIADLKEALQRDDLEPAITKLKKADLALRAEREIAGTGWLPAPLRIPMPGGTQEE
jgi:ParB family chromosome partitioning protein